MSDRPATGITEPPPRTALSIITRDDGWIYLTACVIPAMPVILLTLQWLAAFLTLGHIPRPILDDPRQISVPCSLLNSLTFLSVIAFFPASIGVTVAAFMAWGNRLRAWRVVGAVAFLTTGTAAVWLTNPFRVVNWWLMEK